MPRQAPSHRGPGAPPLEASLAAMRALAHPLRLRIIEAFAEAPRTTKQVAELLGQPPTRLYHHVAALERAGLLRLKETRKNRGTIEKWYEAVGRTLGPGRKREFARRTPKEAAARRAVVMTVLEQSRQEVVAAMHHRRAERPLVARLVMAAPSHRVGELRKRLYEALTELKREFEGDADAVDGRLERWAMTLTFAPVSPRASR
jgi:DNA-binding transcriptional ArsR family regulator